MLNARWSRGVLLLFGVLHLAHAAPRLRGDEGGAPAAAEAKPPAATAGPMLRSARELVARARPALALIRVTGREGSLQGLGAGFVVSSDGLVATNLHVIGDARPFTVELSDGRKLAVTGVHAFDRHLDLAVLRVDTGGGPLPSLELGDSSQLEQGEAVAALGSPLGLQHSVVTGVVSAWREIDGRKMIQLAIPIQPGNSGGPLLDSEGRVLGLVTMMSAREANLGFAVPVNDLKSLLEKPNPVPLARWLTIGTVDPKRWLPLFGAEWRQRGGRILVSGAGDGFGGRSLCLAQAPVPERPLEIGVSVRLEDEAGAAGLVFAADGGHRHYGFYPSNGRLRLTCFDGPTVYEWRVLEEVASPHYRSGQWNDLKVRLEADRISCFINGQLAIESRDGTLASGQVGLAKFRDTVAQFRRFQVGKEISQPSSAGELSPEITQRLDQLPPLADLRAEQLAPWQPHETDSVELLRRHAEQLEQRAAELKLIAMDLHTERVAAELGKLVAEQPDDFDLLRAGLLIATLDEEDVDVEAYVSQVDRMADEVRELFPADASVPLRLAALHRYLFEENGFHGSRFDFDNQANSYLNRVIDDREGLPITLSVLYLELARRLDLPVVGIGLPGHFVVQVQADDAGNRPAQLIDVFDGGKTLSQEDAVRLVQNAAGVPWEDRYLEPATAREILVRMLRNLQGLAQQRQDKEALLRYLTMLLAISPDSISDRGLRAVVRRETGRKALAVADLDWILERRPEGIDLDKIEEMRQFFLK